MESLVAMFVSTRRLGHRAWPLLAAALLAAVVALHAAHPLGEWLFGGFIITLLSLIAMRAWKRTQAVEESSWRDIELGVLLAVAGYATVLHTDGNLDGRFYPLVYVAIGVMSAFAKPSASLCVILLMVVYEAGMRQLAYDQVDLQQLLPHLGFAMVFGLLNTVSLRLEVARLRKASRTELQAERNRIRADARSFRLLRAPGDDSDRPRRERDEERLLCSGVEQIQMSLFFALQLLQDSLKLHTAMLLWLSDDGRQLRISEMVSADEDVCDGPFETGDGLLGAVLNQGKAVCIDNLKPNFVLPYYGSTCPVQSVCAVPVYEHQSLRGVLVADRRERAPFTEHEQELLRQAARLAARAIENERVFIQLERTKVEQGKLYRASERLAQAMSEQEVVDAGVSSASEIAAVDYAVVTSFGDDGVSHEIRAVSGLAAADMVGARFRHETGLVSMALRNRHPLPYRGEYDPAHQVVFTPKLQPPDLPSLLVLPLVSQDEPLGTLVLGSEQPNAFNESARNLLEVLASHLAVSLSNARMVRQLEEQATTDGMTGLLNKRAMFSHADERITAAKRFGRQLSLLIADIDLFKTVNDTYGHDVGDVVIKALAKIHQQAKRNTDAVARFGGEEFVTICDETGAEGALLLAQRIREEFGRTVFHANGTTFQCTCSVGIATFPANADWASLFKAADDALYVSKRSGRDQATVFDARTMGDAAARKSAPSAA